MSPRKQHLGPVDTGVIVLTALASGVSQHWTGPISPTQFVLVLVLLEFVVQPISTLIHELGHAVAAQRLGGRQVFLVVGRGPWATFSLGSIRVNLSPFPSRGVLIRGFCRYEDADVSWQSRARIALAGPAATLVTLIAAIALGSDLWPGSGPTVRYLIVLTVVGLVASLAVNLLPVNRMGQTMPNDGTKARTAIRLHRAGAPTTNVEIKPVQPYSESEAQPQLPHGAASDPQPVRRLSELERRKDHDRAATSVPPPS